jgi:uncharacterized membrane protein
MPLDDSSDPAQGTAGGKSWLSRPSPIWILAFAYIAYAAVGDVPFLSTYAPFTIYVSSFLFVLVYLVHSYSTLGARTATKFLVVSAVLGYSFEFLFTSTGWLGKYVYTADLSPFVGPVPAFIPFLWAALGYFCMLAADNYVVSAGLMVILDLSFDPRFSLTLWTWVPPGEYFGVPVANFIGWFLTSAVIYLVFYFVSGHKPNYSSYGIAFYFLVGIFVGLLPLISVGLYEASAISLTLFVAASGLLFLGMRRSAAGAGLPDSPEGAASPRGPNSRELA